MADNTQLRGNYNIVDDIADRINIRGATSTIFQLHEDKLIRIATNVKTSSGKRAVLTYIPGDSLVFRTIAKSDAYRGRAIVVGQWNITHYEPIKSRDGTVLGVIYVGVPAPKTAIFDIIRESKIGTEGYVYIMNSQGQLIEHPYLKGNNILSIKDPSTGKPVMEEIVSQKEGFFTYNFPVKNNVFEKKIAYSTYFKKWDWFIIASANYNDLLSGLSAIFKIFTILLIAFPVVLLIASSAAANMIFNPISRIIDIAVKVSGGDLTIFIPQDHYRKCVEVKNCTHTDCPAYESRNLSCWRIDGTLCDNGRPLSKEGVDKMEHCRECEVYQKAIRNETDELIEAINNMIMSIRAMILNIKVISDELHDHSDSLSGISISMETESQNQAASIEETTSSNEELMATIENVAVSAKNQADKVSQTSAAMEQLTSSTKLVGENATKVSEEAKLSVTKAHETDQMLRDTTRNINQVSESSKRIVDIVAIINDISDQINLLSLNAAIEAARAGEHGKGFAVVSEEISKLAEATAQSTKEIESVIKTSRDDIRNGAELVNKTAEAITEMMKKIEFAAGLFEEIALSSEEQTKGSEQVMLDVEEVSKMSHQIAMATEEQKLTSNEILKALTRVNDSIQEMAGSSQTVSGSAQELKKKSDDLNNIIYKFKV